MKLKLMLVKVVADPKDGRIIIHYKINGGQVKTYTPAYHIRIRERELIDCDANLWDLLGKFAKRKFAQAPAKKVDPYSGCYRLLAERFLLTSELELLRFMEMFCKSGRHLKDPAPLKRALVILLETEAELEPITRYYMPAK